MSSENPLIKQNENASLEEVSEKSAPLIDTVYNTAPAPSQTSARLHRGDIIGGVYKVLDCLGSGGMSDVYMCEDLSIGRIIAVKTLKSGYSEDSLRRFQTEGKAIAKLEDPNIVKLYGLNTTETGMPILLMEYVPGRTLAQLIENGKALPLQRALKIASQIAEALKSAEKQGVIHRDLKPSNIMIVNPGSMDEKAKILDFGIAKIQGEPSINATQTGEVFGTPKYMSPEQALGKKCDGRADQYAFGCILFEMLSGQAPFHADNAFSLMMAHVQDRIPSLSKTAKQPIPDHLNAVVTKLLQKEPADRYTSMDDVSKAIFESQSWKNTLPKVLVAASVICLLIIVMAVAIVFQDNSKSTKTSNVNNGEQATPSLNQPDNASNQSTPYKASHEALQPSEADKQLLSKVEALENAVKLEIVNQNITDFGLDAIAKAKHLRTLSLAGNRHITSKGVEKLKSLPLISLNLDGTGIDDEASKSIAQISTLKNLDLNNTDISTESCKNLSALPTLKRLWLGSTSIDGRSLPYLSKLTSLKYLSLDRDDVTENLDELNVLSLDELSLKRIPNAKLTAQKKLSSLKGLKMLDLSGTSIDDNDLHRLVQLSGLETLYINGCKNISAHTIEEIALRQSIPHIFSDKRADEGHLLNSKAEGNELIQNGGFDATDLSAPYITCHAGETSIKDWGVVKGSVDLASCFKATSGKNSIDLNGYQARGAITQSIDTITGDDYLLQFDATSHPDAPEVSKSIIVRIDDASKTLSFPDLGNTRSHMHWEHFELPFKAKSARTKITFASLSNSDQGACIDSISVRKLLN